MEEQARVVSWFKAAIQVLMREGVVSKVDASDASNLKRLRKQRMEHHGCQVETLQRCHHGVCGPGFQVHVSSNEAFQKLYLFTNHQVLPLENWHQALWKALQSAYGRVFWARCEGDEAFHPRDFEVGTDHAQQRMQQEAAYDPHFKDEEAWLANLLGRDLLEEGPSTLTSAVAPVPPVPRRPRWGDLWDEEDQAPPLAPSVETPPVADNLSQARAKAVRPKSRSPVDPPKARSQARSHSRSLRPAPNRDSMTPMADEMRAGGIESVSQRTPESMDQPIIDIDDVTLVSWSDLGCITSPWYFTSHKAGYNFYHCDDLAFWLNVVAPVWFPDP
eukprot:symbB.v1.2.028263.t1/scaffold2939.1/size66832/2